MLYRDFVSATRYFVGPPRPHAPGDFSIAGKVTKRAHRGQNCPLCTPACFIYDRRGCPVSFDSVCRRAGRSPPLTHRLALRSPPLAGGVSCRSLPCKCWRGTGACSSFSLISETYVSLKKFLILFSKRMYTKKFFDSFLQKRMYTKSSGGARHVRSGAFDPGAGGH